MAEPSSPTNERITVTFAASQALLAAPLTPHFIHLLQQQLPLRNLHWRPSQSTLDAVAARAAQQGKPAHASSSLAPGSTIRTIQTLDVALKPLTDEIRRWRGDPGYFEQPGGAGLLDRPFVHLYLVVCEDSEHYRTTVRNEIRSWISSLSFFHAKQPGLAANNPAPGTPTLASSSRTSLGLGSLRSATPPVRSDTPPVTGSGPQTPTSSAVPSKSTLPASISIVPTEPEYLIVLITPPEGAGISGLSNATAAAEAKTGMGRFMNKSKANVLEKARADFSTSKKEHVVQISRLPPVPAVPLGRSGLHSMDPTIWAELLTKMREAASATFTTTIEAQEEEIARCGVTKGQQGWDFCSYFLAKDSLARTLDAVGLKDDAVGQYEDLEIVFAQAMHTGAVAFAPIGGDDANDDSIPLLDVNKKPYAELIRRKDISLFDFRCYLFARKSALLGKMGRVAAVMREAPLFIAAVGRMLRRNPRLSSQWIESWIFSAALDVVEQCQAWLIQRSAATSDDGVDQLTPAFQSNKSELLDLARRQLDRIGIQAGHLPALEPFACTSDGGADSSDAARNRDLPPLPDVDPNSGAVGLGAPLQLDEKRTPSRPELRQAIESREHFDSHYLALCERIAAGWKAASRHRDTLHMRTVIATLRYLRADYSSAYESLVSISEAYAAAKFSRIEAHALALQLECHAQLGLPRDRAWVAAALAALRASVQARTTAQIGETQAAKWSDPAFVCDELRRASTAMEREIPVSGFPLFAIAVPSGTARLVGSEDGSLLTVDVTSMLPCAQVVQDVRVCLVGKDSESLWYTSSQTTLQPGRSSVELFNPHPAHGVYTVDVTQIRIARLIFQYDAAAAVPTVVRVPKDGAAPSVKLALPRRIDLDRPRQVQLTVRAGRHNIETAEVRVDAADGSRLVDYAASVAVGTEASIEAGTDCVSLTPLGSEQEVCFTVPLLHVPESGVLDAVVSLSYTSADSPRAAGKKRVLTTHVQLRTALPLGVNVQDFFRTTSLLSKFTISAAGAGSIRLQPVELEHDGDAPGTLEITACASSRQATVTPRQPATYLFRMVKTTAAELEGKLRLTVNYRSLHDEAVALAVGALKTDGWQSEATRLVEEALSVYVRERVDLPAFSITGGVRTGPVDAGWWRREWRTWGQTPAAFTDVLSTVTTALDAVSSPLDDADDTWQTLTIPVDVPSVEYVNAVTLSVGTSLSDDIAVVVGQPVQLSVAITVSRQWAKGGADAKMVYDVVPDFESWLLDGQKRGSFAIAASQQEATFTLTLTAVPLRTGSLALPHVVVHPLASTDEQQASCETYITNAAQSITVLPSATTSAFFLPTTTPAVSNTAFSNPASYDSAMWLPFTHAWHARA